MWVLSEDYTSRKDDTLRDSEEPCWWFHHATCFFQTIQGTTEPGLFSFYPICLSHWQEWIQRFPWLTHPNTHLVYVEQPSWSLITKRVLFNEEWRNPAGMNGLSCFSSVSEHNSFFVEWNGTARIMCLDVLPLIMHCFWYMTNTFTCNGHFLFSFKEIRTKWHFNGFSGKEYSFSTRFMKAKSPWTSDYPWNEFDRQITENTPFGIGK